MYGACPRPRVDQPGGGWPGTELDGDSERFCAAPLSESADGVSVSAGEPRTSADSRYRIVPPRTPAGDAPSGGDSAQGTVRDTAAKSVAGATAGGRHRFQARGRRCTARGSVHRATATRFVRADGGRRGSRQTGRDGNVVARGAVRHQRTGQRQEGLQATRIRAAAPAPL